MLEFDDLDLIVTAHSDNSCTELAQSQIWIYPRKYFPEPILKIHPVFLNLMGRQMWKHRSA